MTARLVKIQNKVNKTADGHIVGTAPRYFDGLKRNSSLNVYQYVRVIINYSCNQLTNYV